METLAPGFENIAESLLKQVEEFEKKVEARSVGAVITVGDGIALADGLADVKANEIVEFASGVAGVAFNLEPDNVGIVVMGDFSDIQAGDEVRATGRIASIPVGDALIGRVINPLGHFYFFDFALGFFFFGLASGSSSIVILTSVLIHSRSSS